jgi:tetratricopeptide (TPR) repeat protein
MLAGSASAAPAAREEALALFHRSMESYRAARFAEAADLLRRAYAISPEPILQYNLARALEGLGDLPGAVKAYEQYLASGIQIVDRPALNERVAALRRQISERERSQRDRERLQHERERLQREREAALQGQRAAEARLLVEHPPPPRRRLNPAPWAIFGVGGLTVVAGGVLLGVGVHEHQQAIDDPTGTGAAQHQLNADRLALSGDICLGVGAAMVGAGLIWGIVDVVQKRRR